jgi:hypothetical protein
MTRFLAHRREIWRGRLERLQFSKSLHGWYLVFGQSRERLRSFMDYAVSLGADHASWLRSQFVRLPDGRRENGKRQVTYFFDPTKAIL